MFRMLAFAGLIAAVCWWTLEAAPAWHRSGASPAELTAALSACRAEATSGLQSLVPGEGRAFERCMTSRGWNVGASPETQVAALR